MIKRIKGVNVRQSIETIAQFSTFSKFILTDSNTSNNVSDVGNFFLKPY